VPGTASSDRDRPWVSVTGSAAASRVMSMPSQAAISDLIPLMYRARWTSFSLSGEVRAYGTSARVWRVGEHGTPEVATDCRYRAEPTRPGRRPRPRPRDRPPWLNPHDIADPGQ
jgi:hypothetical protein